jgi:hypothetical protein
VGVYVPSRFVNHMALAQIAATGLRFFDDNPHLYGTYFPGIPVPVESGADLLSRPPDRVLIMSRAFGDSIARRLSEVDIPADTIASLDR